MTYSATLGPHVPSLGRFDTFANITAASGVVYGTMALCDDVGWVWSDGTQWRQVGVAGTGGRQKVTTGASATVSPGVSFVFLDGVDTTFTLTFPAPVGDGQRLYINATQAVSVGLTLTVTSPGTVIKNAPATLAAGIGCSFVYDLAATTWYRVN